MMKRPCDCIKHQTNQNRRQRSGSARLKLRNNHGRRRVSQTPLLYFSSLSRPFARRHSIYACTHRTHNNVDETDKHLPFVGCSSLFRFLPLLVTEGGGIICLDVELLQNTRTSFFFHTTRLHLISLSNLFFCLKLNG